VNNTLRVCGRENLTEWIGISAKTQREVDGLRRPICNRPYGHEGAHVEYHRKTADRLSEWVADPAE